MLNLVYQALKKRINDKVAPKYTDWYMGQYLEPDEEDGGALLWDTPAVFIEFPPIPWTTMGNSVQAADTSVNIHLVNDSYFDTDQRVTDATLNHFGLEGSVYRHLMNWRCLLSYVPGFEALAGTENDRVLMESVVRLNTDVDHGARRQFVSVQTFSTRIYDYSATKQWASVVAVLELDVIKVNHL